MKATIQIDGDTIRILTPTGDAGEVPRCCARDAWEASPAGQLAAMQMQRDSAIAERDYFERQEAEARAELAERDKGQCPQCDRYFNALRRKDDDVARLKLELAQLQAKMRNAQTSAAHQAAQAVELDEARAELARLRNVPPGWAAEIGPKIYHGGQVIPAHKKMAAKVVELCRTEAAQHRAAELSGLLERFDSMVEVWQNIHDREDGITKHHAKGAWAGFVDAAHEVRKLLQGAGEYPTHPTWTERFAANAERAWQELRERPPAGTWFYSQARERNGEPWQMAIDETDWVGWDAAIIPASANAGQELVVTRPGLEWSEELPGAGQYDSLPPRPFMTLEHPVTGDPVRVEVPRD